VGAVRSDSLGMTAENLAQERFQLTPEMQRPEELADRYDISRERQDCVALRSHQKAVAAQNQKRFRDVIVPVTVRTRKSETVIEADEGPRRDTSLEQLAKLKPVFKPGGTVTAGNASPLNDGAVALLVVSAPYAQAHGRGHRDGGREGDLASRERKGDGPAEGETHGNGKRSAQPG
jgi:acetyl-CoA acyltransferase